MRQTRGRAPDVQLLYACDGGRDAAVRSTAPRALCSAPSVSATGAAVLSDYISVLGLLPQTVRKMVCVRACLG